jgi:hypothetical protein
MTDIKKIQPEISAPATGCAGEPVCFLALSQIDIKPLLKTLAGLCLFFCAMAIMVACGAIVVMLVKSLVRLF